MKTASKWILIVSFFFFGSVSFGIEAKTTKKSPKDSLFELRQSLERVVSSVEPYVHVGIEVVSLSNGQKIYEKNPHQLFTPGSSQKIYTAAAALSLLGVDFHFETCLLTDGEIQNGVLKGNLYLKGSGNPELSVKDLEELIFQLKLLQIETIQGDLVLDNFAFDGVAKGPGWMWDEQPAFWNSPMDALVVNHSCIDLWITPSKANQPPNIFCFPKTEYVSIQNIAKTLPEPVKKPTPNNLKNRNFNKADTPDWQQQSVAEAGHVPDTWSPEATAKMEMPAKLKTDSSSCLGINITRSESNKLEISGECSLDYAPIEMHVPLNEPHLFVGHLLLELLPKYGISLLGSLQHRQAPSEARCLASHFSSPLSLIVRQMMKMSDNLFSDCLFKKVGEQKSGKIGSWKTGATAVKEFLEKHANIKNSDCAVMDGSGESRYNLSSAHHLVSVLVAMHQQKECFPEFFTSLPISGTDGLLRDRLKEEGTKGRIRAKTGTMTGVSSISGYATTQNGELLAFSILINGFTGPAQNYKSRIEDQVCALLAQFSR